MVGLARSSTFGRTSCNETPDDSYTVVRRFVPAKAARWHDYSGFKAFTCTLYACIYIGTSLSVYQPGRRLGVAYGSMGVPFTCYHYAMSAHAGLGARGWM